jgi:hypothetical protein
MGNAGEQLAHGRGHPRFLAEDRRPGDKDIGPGFGRQWSSLFVDASVHFDLAVEFHSFDHLSNALNFGQRTMEEMLMAKPRIDSHDQHQIKVG